MGRSGAEVRPRWRKILYERQPYPDNHFDDGAFLSGLVTNAGFKGYCVLRVVGQSAVVSQQLAAVAAFVALYGYALRGRLGARSLLAVDALLAVAGAASAGRQALGRATVAGVAPVAVVFAALCGLARPLATLGSPLSTDTAHWCCAGALAVHLYAHEYAPHAPESPVALSAALLAALLLASRLPTALHVFAYVSYAVELFALAPLLRRADADAATAAAPPPAHARRAAVSAATVACAAYLLLDSSRVAAAAFLASVAFVSVVCPLWLVCIQRKKMEINGPWDEAVIAPAGAVWRAKKEEEEGEGGGRSEASAGSISRMEQ